MFQWNSSSFNRFKRAQTHTFTYVAWKQKLKLKHVSNLFSAIARQLRKNTRKIDFFCQRLVFCEKEKFSENSAQSNRKSRETAMRYRQFSISKFSNNFLNRLLVVVFHNFICLKFVSVIFFAEFAPTAN